MPAGSTRVASAVGSRPVRVVAGPAPDHWPPGQPAVWQNGSLPGMRTRVGVVLVLLIGVLAGCRQAPLDPGFTTPDPDRPTPVAPAQVRYAAPEGFVEFYDYTVRESLYTFPAPAVEVWIPRDAVGSFTNREAIAVYSYVMTMDVSDWPEERLLDLVQRLVGRAGASVVEPERTTIAGRPAFTVPVVEYDPELNGRLTYQATFIFDGSYLVQSQCRYELRQELIEQTCAALHDSMEIIVG